MEEIDKITTTIRTRTAAAIRVIAIRATVTISERRLNHKRVPLTSCSITRAARLVSEEGDALCRQPQRRTRMIMGRALEVSQEDSTPVDRLASTS